ncbi:MAG: SoxR reducing system RseC family protein [Tannerellaceae bacterium]|nr:SoxR reducing system RseC family protein [Tannerellaceae bacterium]
MSRLQNMGHEIQHTGIIQRIEGNSIFVKIIQQSACAGCHAKGICSAADSKEKLIEVTDYSGQFNVNEEIVISGKSSLGLFAVFLAFIIPLLLIIVILVAGHLLSWQESISALTALLTLLPYYVLLYFNRDKLKRTFIFTLRKLNQ